MREIKFRGLLGNEWHYGSLIRKLNPHKEQDETWCYLIHNGALTAEVVEEKSIGQFTGLKDKNGKEIFEGDIVKRRETEHGGGYIGEVLFSKVRAAFIIRWNDGINERYDDLTSCDENLVVNASTETDYLMEVIGNIYENPERL